LGSYEKGDNVVMERKKLHIMAIGAHVGDVELSSGITLAKHAILGDDITTVALTAGERGAPSSIPVEEFKEMNIDSASQFAKMLGGRSIVLNYRDGEVPENENIKFQICDIIRMYKPDVLITHWKNSIHKDHMTTHRVVVDAHFYAALGTMERSKPAHWAKGPYFAENWEDAQGFEPYVFMDVTEGFELWKSAVRKLWLTENSPWFKYLDYYDALSKARGALIHKDRAETFAIDPSQMRMVLSSF
jgi:LmbE family N-acetylglucosaminyl deacetylase